MKTTNLDDKILELCEWSKSLGGKKARVYDNLSNDMTDNFLALKQLIKEQRVEELRLRLTTNISSPERDWIEKRIAELTDSHKEDKK